MKFENLCLRFIYMCFFTYSDEMSFQYTTNESNTECDCGDNCELPNPIDQQIHDCHFIETLLKKVPIEIISALYDTVQFITSMKVENNL